MLCTHVLSFTWVYDYSITDAKMKVCQITPTSFKIYRQVIFNVIIWICIQIATERKLSNCYH